jgi:endonuclease YncB( thermonuclease family)
MSEFGPYPAVVTDWHDGLSDTCHANLDLGFAVYLYGHDLDGKPVFSLRIFGINAPELSDPSGSGKTALAYAEQLCPPGTHVTVVSHGFDKYGGRADCTLTLPDGRDFAGLMLGSGNAVPMAG